MILYLQIIPQSTVQANVDSTQLTTQTPRTATLTLQAGSNMILNAAFTLVEALPLCRRSYKKLKNFD
ncbi:MAG: hypothetical protein C4323_11865 [Mastigocladus sp. ERB_26_2]